MERRDFFKKLGIGVAAIVATPLVMIEATEPKLNLNIKGRYLRGMSASESGVYMYAEWSRELTADEVYEIYRSQINLVEIS